MQQPRRARQLGIILGTLPTGPRNAITDVRGVRVGHSTVVSGTDVRTGVTAVVPDQLGTGPVAGDPPARTGPLAGGWRPARRSLPAGIFVGNGHGKMVGSTQVAELGEIETPVLLTATLSTFRVADALVSYMLAQPGRERVRSINPVVAETNDGYLSDIRARPISEAHVLAALAGATTGLPAEGAVGAGTGTAALGFKAGIGTASRVVGTAAGAATVGVLVQSNFSGVLRIGGVAVPPESVGIPARPSSAGNGPAPADPPGNSCVFVIATDAPVDARQLGRVARRAVFALGRVGSDFAGGSGDYAIAFGTAPQDAGPAAEADLEPIFGATLEAAEESVVNSLLMARTTTGRDGHVRHALPHDRLLGALGLPEPSYRSHAQQRPQVPRWW